MNITYYGGRRQDSLVRRTIINKEKWFMREEEEAFDSHEGLE